MFRGSGRDCAFKAEAKKTRMIMLVSEKICFIRYSNLSAIIYENILQPDKAYLSCGVVHEKAGMFRPEIVLVDGLIACRQS